MCALKKIINIGNIFKNPPKRNYTTDSLQKFKHSFTDLRCLAKQEVKVIFQGLECIISDADGVLWLNDESIKGSVETFNWLQDQGKMCYIATNNSTRTRENLREKACSMGLKVEEQQIISTAFSTAKYLEKLKFNKKAYVVGSKGLSDELKAFNIKHIEIQPEPMLGSTADLRQNLKLDNAVAAVIVGFDEFFSFPKLTKAFCYLRDPECLFIATNMDDKGPTPTIMLPGTACFVRAIETCSKRLATVIGKPNIEFVTPLIRKNGIKPSKTLMIGDRGSTDMLFGNNCNFYTLFVSTGVDTLDEVKHWQTADNCELRKQIPDFYLSRLGDLKQILNE